MGDVLGEWFGKRLGDRIISIFLCMPDSITNNQSPADKAASSEQASAASSQTPSSARIKRMRGWLGVKSTSSLGGYDDGGGGVVYGDGHSGWNR